MTDMHASKDTLSLIIGLGPVLCFPYRLNYWVQDKLLSSLKPGIKPAMGILKYTLSTGNKATGVWGLYWIACFVMLQDSKKWK